MGEQQAWEVDPREFRRAMSEASSINDLARTFRVTRDKITRYAQRHGISLSTGLRCYGAVAKSADVEDRELSDDELIQLCEERGIAVLLDPIREDNEFEIEVATESDQSFEVGVVSDPHLGSKKQQLTYLNAAYDYFERKEISTVFLPGDVTAGADTMHRGMQYEMFVHGGSDQSEYAAHVYPQRPGITTYAISGNHDHSHMKANGFNIVKDISKERPDIKYLGMSGAYMTINGIRFYVMHPAGGVPYARSYRLQKIIEQFAPEAKPKVLIMGHLHSTCVLESYRNVYAFMAGCFEAQTTYMKERGLNPEIGFSTLRVEYDENGAVSFTKKWVPFYVPREYDFSLS